MEWTKLAGSLLEHLQKNMPINVLLGGVAIGSLISCHFVKNYNLIIAVIISTSILVLNLICIIATYLIEKWYMNRLIKRASDSTWRKIWWNQLTADEKEILITMVANHGTAKLLRERTAVQSLMQRNYISNSGYGYPQDYDDVTQAVGMVFNYTCQPFVFDMVSENDKEGYND